MHDLQALFHKIYDVQGLIRFGGLALLAAVIFSETGLLVGFFLPGDSLLVTAGLYCTTANPDQTALLNIVSLNAIGILAAIVGDTVGYWIGAKSGTRLFTREQSLLFSKKHLLRTKEFYEKHGGKTIVIARFMPFVRTFAPVVAGIARMSYKRFLTYNVFGGIGWVFSMTMLGYSLGKVYPPITKQIDKVIIVIIFVSLLPAMVSWVANRKKGLEPDAGGLMAGKTKAKPAAKPAAKTTAKAPAAKPAARPAVAKPIAAKPAPAKPAPAKPAPAKPAPAKPAPAKPAAAPPKAKSPAPAQKPHKPRAAFPKKNLPPNEAEFGARLPLALGKRFESVREFLKKQPGVGEELYYYGPKTGWAYRYVRGSQSLCSIVIHDDRLMGIVALDPAAQTAVVWEGLSPIGQRARKVAHGSPALLWVDVPFEGTGAKDFQAMLKAKLRTLPAPPAP